MLKKVLSVITDTDKYNKSINSAQITGIKLSFELPKKFAGWDVYNITAPFTGNGYKFIAGRIEERDAHDSYIGFFKRKFVNNDLIWTYDDNAPEFNLEDPFVTRIKNELIFGGVEITDIGYRTVFYCGKDIYSLEKFAAGPMGMKDIRLVELKDENRIGVFTRPQGDIAGKGKIGYTEIKELYQLDDTVRLENADLIDTVFTDEIWGGVNGVYYLSKQLGVLGHIACLSDGKKIYRSTTSNFDPNKRQTSNFRIIAGRENFPPGPAKADDLENVIFSGDLIFSNDYTFLWGGLSDTEAGFTPVGKKGQNPFIE